jgi:hypothetical protein
MSLDEILDEVLRLNTFLVPGALCAFQQEILSDHTFRFAGTPATGCCLVEAVGRGAPYDIGYRFVLPDGVLWLATQHVARGSRLAIGYRPETEECFPVGEQPNLVRDTALRDVAATLRTAEARLSEAPAATPTGACVIIGHPNFAHMVWNELPALVAARPGTAPQVYPMFESLGAFDRLAPELGLRPWAGPALEAGTVSTSTMFVRPGSLLVTRAAKAAVLEVARQTLTPWGRGVASRIEAATGPVIWLSVRTDVRTARNQDEFVAATIRAFHREWPDATFVLDGFSLPEDFAGNPAYKWLRAGYENRIRVNEEFMAGIDGRVPDLADRIIRLNGRRLLDVVHLAGFADYYVCHVGTMHHKIGWLHEVPGFLHFRPGHAAPGAVARWHRQMAEDAVLPDAVASGEVDLVENAAARVERNHDYRFHDPVSLAARIVDLSRPWLAG